MNIIKWRPIYEVIYEAYFIGYKIFSGDFMQECKDNSNEDQFISLEMENNINRMTMEIDFFAPVIMLRRKDLKCFATDKNKSEAKFKF